MIVKIAARGKDPGKLMAYLASDRNQHCQQRIVAGSVQYPGHLDKAMVAQVAADLRANQQLTGTQVPKGHIYHVTLALAPNERQLSDTEWEVLSNDFMDSMGFTGAAKSPVKWTAVNHGANAAGADHVHIVMSTVRQNGTQVNLHNDMLRASKVATKLEQKHGLQVLQSRLAPVGAGSVPFTGKEVERARELGKPEPDRVTLEREIRALAAASTSEAEFVRRVRGEGILIKPFPAQGKVTGYSVAEPDGKPQWFGGGKLARDLTLPQLRRRWPDGGEKAEREWRQGTPTKPAHPGGRETLKVVSTPATISQVESEITALGEKVKAASPADLAELSHEVAGTLAAASKAIETTPGPLAKASREVGGWAQPRVLGTEKRSVNHAGRGMALLLIQAMDPGSEKSKAIMIHQLAQMVVALYRLHQASRLMAVGNGKVAAMSIDNNHAKVGVSAAATAVTAWAEHRAKAAEAARPKPAPVHVPGPLPGGDVQHWSAESIRQDRMNAKIREVQAMVAFPEPRATAEQQQRIGELAEKFELQGVKEAAAGLPRTEVDRLIERFEAASQGLDVKAPLTDGQLDNALGGHDITTPDQAVAFEDELIRKAEERGSKVVPTVVDADTVAPSEKPVVDEMVGDKDPRTWASAEDGVTSKQRYTLQQAGFTSEEIGTLKKGSASYVIGSPDHRAAFDRNTKWVPPATPPQRRSQRKATDIRGPQSLPSTDIRRRGPVQ